MAADPIYTCPMHPEVEDDRAGDCPHCGMALEPRLVQVGAASDNKELQDMLRRFRVALVLGLAVFYSKFRNGYN
jgi:P-type Cu+ transporter